MDDFRSVMPKTCAAIEAMFPLAEGKPVVHIHGRDGSVKVCKCIRNLRIASEEWCFYADCEWIDPPPIDVWPEHLPRLMTISASDCLELGPGWWQDTYFGDFFVYDPALVARSLAGDHSWTPDFLAAARARPPAKRERRRPRRRPK